MVKKENFPFPFSDRRLYVIAFFREKEEDKVGVIEIPKTLPPYRRIHLEDGRFIRTENIILKRVSSFFLPFQVQSACVIRVTRSADLQFVEKNFGDTVPFPDYMKAILELRKYLPLVRLEIDRNLPEAFREILLHLTSIKENQIQTDLSPLGMDYCGRFLKEETGIFPKKLLFPSYTPLWPGELSEKGSILYQIQKQDRLLFYPYDSAAPFLRFLSEAATRTEVISIQITIYRLAPSSKVVDALCHAARNGKRVRVLMELRARFDEENNLCYAKQLQAAGCEVIYGFREMKCHSKICLVTLKDQGFIRYITQIGTGNYNERTNRIYSDFCLFTASQEIGKDADAFFENMAKRNPGGSYQKLLVSPKYLKPALFSFIDEEIRKGSLGYICIKVNSVTEWDLMEKLREASQAGVEVHLIVRGICCILPGVPTYTDHISVISIVGRFLEHARVYWFGRGEDAKIYLSSADLMERNLNRRVEIACPVEDEKIRAQLKAILLCQLRDAVKGSWLQPDGTYEKKGSQTRDDCQSSQEIWMKQPLPGREWFFWRQILKKRFFSF